MIFLSFLNTLKHTDKRTFNISKNISSLIVIKGLNILIGLLLVPITIKYLSPTKYGIWITLSSIIGWFGFFDIGLGNGLRNKFAEALAKNDHKLAKTYVSTTYAILIFIVIFILAVFYTIQPYLNWHAILNSNEDLTQELELKNLAIIVFTFFCLQLIVKLITTVLTADQKPARASLFDLIGKFITLLSIYILTKTTQESLLYLGIVMSAIPFAILSLSNIFYFNGKYKLYRPSIKYIDLKKAPILFSLGIKFFIIQVSAVILYQTDNIVISQLFGPSNVTPYNIAFRYLSILLMAFSIILLPFWSAFTDAWSKQDLDWIKETIRKLHYIWFIIVIAAFFMVVFAPYIYRVWIGKEITISFMITLLMALWIILNAWNSIYSYFLNGLGIIKIQLFLGLIAAFVNIPIAIYLGHKISLIGILIANIIVVIPSSIILPIQYKKIISLKAHGIWIK